MRSRIVAAWIAGGVALGALAVAPILKRDSIEDLIERARRERAAVQQRLQSEVAALVHELEASPPPKELSAKVERAVALGAEATPLLVRYVDPGVAPVDGERLRSQQVAVALARMDTSAITTELLSVLRSGSSEGRRNALRVLQTTRDQARVAPEVEKLFRAGEGSVKTAALKTLIAFGGDSLAALLAEILGGGDDQLVGLAIDGLADQKAAGSVEAIRKVLAQPQTAARHTDALLHYFRVLPDLVEPADVAAFVRMAQSAATPLEIRVTIVEGLYDLGPALNAEFKRSLEPVVDSADRRLREAGLVLLAKLGDKNARRDVIKEYDDLVEKNDRWADAYVRRADMYVKILDDDEAIKDYRQALSVGRDDAGLQPETYVKLARCYVRRNKLKDAADVLDRAPISSARLRELADDPEFAPLRKSKYGKDVFGVD
jgi:tetratricopeptide (TPR) repeat protein